MNAVGDGRRTAQKMFNLLDNYKNNFGLITEVIAEEVVNVFCILLLTSKVSMSPREHC